LIRHAATPQAPPPVLPLSVPVVQSTLLRRLVASIGLLALVPSSGRPAPVAAI